MELPVPALPRGLIEHRSRGNRSEEGMQGMRYHREMYLRIYKEVT